MSETWTIGVGGHAYTTIPLTRCAPSTPKDGWQPISLAARAGESPELATLFPDTAPAPAQEIRAETPVSPELPYKLGRDGDGERNRYVIISDMKSGSISALEEEIFNLGSAYCFMPQAWILTSDISLSSIRGA